ncbi:hypothetical protein SASPL_152367 [Salvia splendens]|uniref:Myb/SANT-like DNA-binding domain-containing protein n=1 Tax=Salvia splendens TaxID=180675 RepID=A0A8X8W3R1_SALSN|nr:hypothetical protein SASPL_152367 [Salvia splendens]
MNVGDPITLVFFSIVWFTLIEHQFFDFVGVVDHIPARGNQILRRRLRRHHHPCRAEAPLNSHVEKQLHQPSCDGAVAGDEGGKTARLRWTRQEILVLIQGKRVAENRVRRGRAFGSAFGSGQIEPKGASISSYCKRHEVNRGPVQCRKRWSNLAGDFKKIKE